MTQDRDSQLAACESIEAFANCAAALGIALTPEQLATAARPDPAGISLHGPAPAGTAEWPAPPWHPVHVSLIGAPAIDWAHFGRDARAGFADQMTLRRVLERPFNRLFRRRMTLEDFAARAPDPAPPKGLIFHMSRTGSTLAARMLGALPDTLAISELQPVNDALLLAHLKQDAALLRAVLTAYAGKERALIVHFDAWHALMLPAIRAAFPGVPFAFLHRDGVEVMVSHARLGATDLFSRAMPRVWNIGAFEDEDELLARALGKICASAAENLKDGGLAIDYRELPDAVVTKILPHFGIEADAATRERMRHLAKGDPKSGRGFVPDADAKQREAGERLRRLAAEHIRFPSESGLGAP
jgi:hypothetical protein